MKTTSFLGALLCVVLLAAPVSVAQQEETPTGVVRTIVIDPGHGGDDDPGAVGPSGLQERHLVLDIALNLRDQILNDPTMRASGVRVVLTRTADVPVSLEQRAAIANNADGDLFISIHANGHRVRSARGAETYFLSLKASDEHARMVAEIENQGLEESANEAENAQDDGLKLILFDFIHKQYIAESKFLAEHIQDEFNESINNGNRGIRQAPLRVLKGVAMPAVLVEMDFITNPAREQLLADPVYQSRFASSMLRAISTYKRLKERGYSSTHSGSEQQKSTP